MGQSIPSLRRPRRHRHTLRRPARLPHPEDAFAPTVPRSGRAKGGCGGRGRGVVRAGFRYGPEQPQEADEVAERSG